MIRKIGVALLLVGALLTAFQIRSGLMSNYYYERNYLNLWELAYKSSTLSAKQQYISQFISALETGYAKGDFADYSTLCFYTPNDSFKENLAALKTFSERLTEIQKMNPNSFEYNIAMEQIRLEERSAGSLLNVFKGCYDRVHYPLGGCRRPLCEWIWQLLIALEIILIITGLYFIINGDYAL
jgi:hypothetical protein